MRLLFCRFANLPLKMLLLLVGVIAPISIAAELDGQTYSLNYLVKFVPENESANVQISIDNGLLLQKLRFDNSSGVYTEIRANGKLVIKDKQVYWELPERDAKLSYNVKLTHERSPGKFDARVTPEWALFRGDDLIPPVETLELNKARAIAELEFVLPNNWSGVETGWPRKKGNTFTIDNPERLFDRPIGWMTAGNIGTRRATIKKTAIAISAPAGEGMRRMDALTFFNFVWPELYSAFEKTPRKLLVVGAGDPMWRGGLSAPNSLFLHTDRPLVSENGTSPLLHELTHMVTRISGASTAKTNDDWIAEGLAEFYSFELLYRANGMTKSRRNTIIKNLAKWGGEVKHLRKSKSTGQVTARAVVLLDELDKEIRKRSNNKYNIDDVTRDLMVIRKVSLEDLRNSVVKLIGPKIDALDTTLLK
jgi:predicted metalloprotease with PDZ domain